MKYPKLQDMSNMIIQLKQESEIQNILPILSEMQYSSIDTIDLVKIYYEIKKQYNNTINFDQFPIITKIINENQYFINIPKREQNMKIDSIIILFIQQNIGKSIDSYDLSQYQKKHFKELSQTVDNYLQSNIQDIQNNISQITSQENIRVQKSEKIQNQVQQLKNELQEIKNAQNDLQLQMNQMANAINNGFQALQQQIVKLNKQK